MPTDKAGRPQRDGGYLPALRFPSLTSIYDPVIRWTTRVLKPGGELHVADWGARPTL